MPWRSLDEQEVAEAYCPPNRESVFLRIAQKLYVRVLVSGRKTFVFRHTNGRHSYWRTIGDSETMSYKEAVQFNTEVVPPVLPRIPRKPTVKRKEPIMEQAKIPPLPDNASPREKRVHAFMKVYAVELKRCIQEYPREYAFSASRLDSVLEKMNHSFMYKNYNIDGRAIKATCQILGIRHTRGGMELYFEGK